MEQYSCSSIISTYRFFRLSDRFQCQTMQVNSEASLYMYIPMSKYPSGCFVTTSNFIPDAEFIKKMNNFCGIILFSYTCAVYKKLTLQFYLVMNVCVLEKTNYTSQSISKCSNKSQQSSFIVVNINEHNNRQRKYT